MYHINNNAFSCVLKVMRLQSDIRNAVGNITIIAIIIITIVVIVVVVVVVVVSLHYFYILH